MNSISSNIYPLFNNEVANSNYIDLTLNEYNTNRILDFGFSIEINRIPIYNIGSRTPIRTDIIFPINITCNITFEADENFSGIILTDFPQNKIQHNIEIDIYSNQTNELMKNYIFNNMTLISDNSSLNVDGNLTISRTYAGQIFNSIDDVEHIGLWDFGFIASGINFFIDWGNVNVSATGTGFNFGIL